MIDHRRIATGYDIEILLGAEFFRAAVQTWFDADLFPAAGWTVGALTFQADPPVSAAIFFETVLAIDENGDEIQSPADLVIILPVTLSHTGGRRLDIRAFKIFVRLEQTEITNETTGLVDRVDLRLAYVSMDADSRQRIRDEFPLIDLAIDAVLRQELDREFGENLVPGQVQKMAVRKLPAEGGFKAAYGIYLNLDLKIGPLQDGFLVLPPESDDQPVDRGDVSLRQNFLAPDFDIVVGAPQALYDRLARNQMHGFTEGVPEREGLYFRPLYESGPGSDIVGNYQKLWIGPVPTNLDAFPPPSLDDLEYILAAKAEVSLNAVDVDVEIRIDFKPVVKEDGTLDIDVHIHEPEADISFFEGLIFFLGGLIGLLVAPISGGVSLLGFGLLSGMAVGILRGIKEVYEGRGQRMVEQQSGRGDGLAEFLSMIPTRTTIMSRRVDPFFHHLFQVVAQFEEVTIHPQGMSFAAKAKAGSEIRPIPNIRLISRQRLKEPLGELRRLIYEVPAAEEVEEVERFEQLDPTRRPAWFALSPSEAIERVRNGQLQPNLLLKPLYIRKRRGCIAEFFFDSWSALAPHEAGELQRGRVLRLRGADLIRPRDRRPYYRSRADQRQSNNLSNLPRYTCFRSRLLGEWVLNAQRQFSYLFDGSEDVHWQAESEISGQTALEIACHLANAYGLMRDWVQAVGWRGVLPSTTWNDLDNAGFAPGDLPQALSREDVLDDMTEHARRLADAVAFLRDENLDFSSFVPLLASEATTHQLVERFVDYIWRRYGIVHRAVDAARQE